MSDSTDTTPPSSSLQEPRLADEPFNDTAADVILRTSDQVDFYACNYILSLASPFFKTMFSLPQSRPGSVSAVGDRATGSHPVIDVSEDSRTLNFVLRFCYPLCRPSMTGLEEIGPVLLAACKYDMEIVLDVAKGALERCIKQDALGVFALACCCELFDICSKAANRFVKQPFLSLESKELDHITAAQYHRLLDYHQRHARNQNFVMSSEEWSNSASSVEEQPSLLASPPPVSGSLPPPVALPQDAGIPFDDMTTDLVLRSSDQVNFHVHSFIISFASPVFKRMIAKHNHASTPETRPVGGEANLSPTIDVSEDSRTLDIVLRRCYPAQVPRLSQISEARLVLAAGLKYDIGVVKALAEAALIELVDDDIVGVWSIALRYKLHDACIAAARRFLRHPKISLHSVELSHASARQYDELLRYHMRCGEVASAVASSRSWFRENQSSFPSRQSRCHYCWSGETSECGYWYAPSSLWTFLTAAKSALETRPCGQAVLSDEVWSKWPRSHCPYNCSQSYWLDIAFAQAFANEVDRAVAEVEVPSFV